MTIDHWRCPLCKKKANTLVDLPNYLYCSRCQLAWVKQFKRPTYNETYYKGASSIASKLFSPVALMFYRLRTGFAPATHIRLWIDVGAGDGEFLKHVQADRKLGVEISDSARHLMEESGIETMTERAFLASNPLAADVISFWHVLEHLEKPWVYLKAARKHLVRGGTLIIGIPNIDSLEFQIFRNHWFHLVPNFHLWHHSPRSLERFLKKYGFTIRAVDYWSIEHHLTGVLQSFINKSAGSDSILHRFIKRGQSHIVRPNDAFWSIFWLTIGAPVVILFWLLGALTHKSGTFVAIAR